MAGAETDFEMVLRHVREGEACVARQREIIAELAAGGHPTDMAETLLAQFETILLEHKAHLARIAGRRD